MIGAEHNAAEFWEQRYNEQHRTLHSAEDVIAELRADLAALREAAQAVVEFRDDFVSACQRGGLSDVLVREQEAWDALHAALASADSESRGTS